MINKPNMSEKRASEGVLLCVDGSFLGGASISKVHTRKTLLDSWMTSERYLLKISKDQESDSNVALF